MDYSQALFEAIADSAVLIDKAGRIVDWNPAATTLFGYSKKEVLGRSINLIYQHSIPFPKVIHNVLAQEKKWVEETAFVRKNGIKGHCRTSVALINATSSPHKAAALVLHHNVTDYKITQNTLQTTVSKLGNELRERLDMTYACSALMAKTITARLEVEKSLRESELRFHLLAENATDMISRHSPDGSYLYVSPSCKSLLGFVPEELVGRNTYKLLHYDDVNRLKKVFNRRKCTANYQTVTYRIRNKEGEYRWFESNVRLVPDGNSRSIREIQTASRDITDRIMDKKARLRGQQLAHVFRLSTMEEMASGMAHEISQPLAAIVNYTQGCVRYLQKDSHDPTQIIEIMNKAVTQAERAGEVIHRLKNFFCKGQLLKAPCKVNSIIRETVSLIRNDVNSSKTKIDFDLAKDIPIISVDKIQFQQVLLNLVQNAIEAMNEIAPRNRKLHIQTRPIDKDAIEITVCDTGPGFSKDIINKVFKPFFSTKANGRGMGLAICRSIIEAHGGQFTINPNTNNHSWIKFTLPVN